MSEVSPSPIAKSQPQGYKLCMVLKVVDEHGVLIYRTELSELNLSDPVQIVRLIQALRDAKAGKAWAATYEWRP